MNLLIGQTNILTFFSKLFTIYIRLSEQLATNSYLALKYFSYINISYQMRKTWSNCIGATVLVLAENELI